MATYYCDPGGNADNVRSTDSGLKSGTHDTSRRSAAWAGGWSTASASAASGPTGRTAAPPTWATSSGMTSWTRAIAAKLWIVHKNQVEAALVSPAGERPIRCMGVDHLVKSKQVAGRSGDPGLTSEGNGLVSAANRLPSTDNRPMAVDNGSLAMDNRPMAMANRRLAGTKGAVHGRQAVVHGR